MSGLRDLLSPQLSPLRRFLLRLVIWIPLAFFVWYSLAWLWTIPIGWLTRLALDITYPELLESLETAGHHLIFVTGLEITTPDGRRGAVVLEINPLIYAYSLPLLLALTAATHEDRWLYTKLAVAYLALLPFQAWGVYFELLKSLAIEAGPQIADQFPVGSAGREFIALGYQFGYLMLPVISATALWIALNRPFLNRLLDSREVN